MMNSNSNSSKSSSYKENKKKMENFKTEVANSLGVNLKQGYNGDLTSKQAGSIGGQMVNIMTPVRTLQFVRKSRINRGHTVTVEYTFSLAV